MHPGERRSVAPMRHRLSPLVLPFALTLAVGLGCAGSTPKSALAAGPKAAAAAPKPAPLPVIAAPAKPDPEMQRLAGSVLLGGHVMEYLRDLSDGYGPRLTGSPVLDAAAQWAVGEFKKAGLENAKVEPFTITNGWQRREATARILTPTARPLHVSAVAWTPPTPAAGIQGEVVVVRDWDAVAVMRREELNGKILFKQSSLSHSTDNPRVKFSHALEPMRKAGVAAILFEGHAPNNAPVAHSCPLCPELVAPIPLLDVGMEDAKLLKRTLDKGAVTVEVINTSPVSGPTQVPNVTADIRGASLPDEIVVVGAHLDAWDFGAGAQDNGSGTVTVLEVARAIHALGRAPKRTIRFALFGGEEQGLLGSRAYVKAHAAELEKTVVMLNTDYGAGAPKGWTADGRPEVVKRFEPFAKALLTGLGGATLGDETRCDTDHCPFWLEGVPTLNLDVDNSKYFEIHHQAGDTYDKVDPAALSSSAAVVAVTAFALADLSERFAPRLDHDTVIAHAKEGKLYESLVIEGVIAK